MANYNFGGQLSQKRLRFNAKYGGILNSDKCDPNKLYLFKSPTPSV